jgi:hypothetical protein
MGIKNLLKFLSEKPNIVKKINLNDYYGKKIAIDISILIYQVVISIRNSGADITNKNGDVTSHILGLFNKTINFLEKGIIPVYVFWHALISRDWYRHWRLNINATPSINRSLNTKRFLLYARAWTGTREYRLKFIEEVIRTGIHESIKYNFTSIMCF